MTNSRRRYLSLLCALCFVFRIAPRAKGGARSAMKADKRTWGRSTGVAKSQPHHDMANLFAKVPRRSKSCRHGVDRVRLRGGNVHYALKCTTIIPFAPGQSWIVKVPSAPYKRRPIGNCKGEQKTFVLIVESWTSLDVLSSFEPFTFLLPFRISKPARRPNLRLVLITPSFRPVSAGSGSDSVTRSATRRSRRGVPRPEGRWNDRAGW